MGGRSDMQRFRLLYSSKRNAPRVDLDQTGGSAPAGHPRQRPRNPMRRTLATPQRSRSSRARRIAPTATVETIVVIATATA